MPTRSTSNPSRMAAIRCKGCAHHRRPGRSDPGYCGGRDDLPLAYGENHSLKKLPRDRGESCTEYVEK